MRLQPAERAFIELARRAVLTTIRPDGRPRPVPVCFCLLDRDGDDLLVSPLDEKPKRDEDPRQLARVRDVLARPEAVLLFDRWDEDWSALAWLRVEATARLVEPGAPEHAAAVGPLRVRYPQYAGHALERRPMLAFRPTSASSWGRLPG